MGRHTKSKIVKMKLFAVLAIAVASRQVNKYDNDVEIGGVCTADGKECGLTNTECKDLVCACTGDNVPAADNLNCEAAKVIADIGGACATDGAQCGNNAECTTDGPKCGGNQECKASADDASKMTCQCEATHEPKEGKCEPLKTDGSAALYSVATAFLALILA